MPTVYLVPAGHDCADGAASGDYLLRPAGDGLYEVGKQGTSCTWVGTLAQSLLPALPTVEQSQAAPDQSQVLTAVQGLESAQHLRGG